MKREFEIKLDNFEDYEAITLKVSYMFEYILTDTPHLKNFETVRFYQKKYQAFEGKSAIGFNWRQDFQIKRIIDSAIEKDLVQWEESNPITAERQEKLMKVLQKGTEYHLNPAIGSSLLKRIHTSTLLHALTEDMKVTRPMILGAALHAALLEPESFKADFVFAPKVDKRTKEGKEMHAYFLEQSVGKTLLDESEEVEVMGMKQAILAHSEAMKMLSGGESEYSYFAEHGSGIKMKCRPDYHNPKARALIDIKSTSDASYHEFCKEIGNRAYYLQAAYYVDVFNKVQGTDYDDFFFIAVENKFPFAVQVFRLGADELAIGREAYQKAFAKYVDFIKLGVSIKDFEKMRDFGYQKDIAEARIPSYILNQAVV